MKKTIEKNMIKIPSCVAMTKELSVKIFTKFYRKAFRKLEMYETADIEHDLLNLN